MRAVFFGTPPIAVPSLRAVARSFDLRGVVCQPDRPQGRGLRVTEPAVKLAAMELGVEVHQPVKVRTGTVDQWLRERDIDVAIVLAYGRILPAAVLQAPRRGCLNLHASLLPRYRGAAPINWAIINGDTTTGVSLMQMDEGMDTGAVFTRRSIAIGPTETAGDLAMRLGVLAAEMVVTDVPRVLSGELTAVPQDSAAATAAPPLTKDDCVIDWGCPARTIVDRVRGLTPRPGAHTLHRGKRLKVLEVALHPDDGDGPVGEVVRADRDGLLVQSRVGRVAILRAQLEGRKALGAAELVNGRALSLGERLGG